MGLLSTEVEVRLGAANIDYFEQLGYEIPRYYNNEKGKYVVKRGTTIFVKVKDLKDGSNVKVDLECDNCFKKIKRTYNDYNKLYHDNGKCYCKKCALGILHSGKNNSRYNPNKTNEERENGRSYPEYIEFIKSVLARDNYTCYCCGKNSSDGMEVHHLFGYSGFPQYRLDQSQAITLCKNCHKAFHFWHKENYGFENKGKCTRQQFEKWNGEIVNELEEYKGNLITARPIYDYEDKKIYNSAIECSKAFGIANTSIYNCCNHKIHNIKYIDDNNEIIYRQSRSLTVRGHHLFWLDEYEKMSNEELRKYTTCKHNRYGKGNYESQRKSVVCITTGELFQMLKDGGEKYNIKNPSNISECCTSKKKSAGKLSDGTPLQWIFYDDFLKLPIEEQNEILSRNQESSNDGSFIM